MNEMSSTHPNAGTVMAAPDRQVDVRETFGIEIDWDAVARLRA